VSQSPASTSEVTRTRDVDSAYRQHLKRVNELLKRGASLSGHERNCAFLNLRGESFATISAVSGIDFADDGRGLATSDWDGDGDLDIWLTNRTGPRVRFLRNELPGDHAFLFVEVKGRECNRDAIGARVMVKLAASDQPLIRTLHAGEGYLSQSSKWLHFGLGPVGASIESVTVDWPGGATQVWTDLQPNCRYRLEQGVAEAQLVPSRREVALAPSPQPEVEATHVARVPLSSRIPLPRLPVATAPYAAPVDALQIAPGKPVLITLWASWCGLCQQELAELAHGARSLEGTGVTVLAVNVDDQLRSSPREASSSRRLEVAWSELGPHFAAYQATPEFVRRLQSIHDLPFGREMTMPLPMSFLIDAKGELAVVYRGRSRLDQILADLELLTQDQAHWQASVPPLPGQWNAPPPATDLLNIPRQLLDRQQTDDALQYVQTNEKRLAANKEFPTLRAWLGDQLLQQNRAAEGRAQYESAIQASRQDVTLMNNLAWLLATHADDEIRDGTMAVHWAERAAQATDFQVPGILDTLAASYAEVGEFDRALEMARRAAELAKAKGQSQLVEALNQRAALYARRQPYRP
jgi:thiol-disulfide isomerase/thioredoxin